MFVKSCEKQVTGINKYNTPIYNYLRDYAGQGIQVFHMPGHKLAKGIPQEMREDILQLDVTEVEGTDNLHFPEGIIKEAQEQAAKAFGADHTFFLVNGSTCGIQAAILSVCRRGQKIIIGRDSHRAVVAGLVLSGAEPVFVYPGYNEEFGISEAVDPQSIEECLRSNPDAAAVLITRPNYYGICGDIKEICRVVHAHGKVLIVDEAHGAHLAFNGRLPEPALKHGADICIQSAHKTLPAVTQGSYLHVKGGRVDIDRLKTNLALLQTSSPSYIIMAYLDIAREIMITEGKEKLEVLLKELEGFEKELGKCGAYKLLTDRNIDRKAVQDPTRLVINISGLGISGYRAEKILREQFKTQIEMADHENLVLILTITDNRESLAGLLNALKGLASMEFSEACGLESIKQGKILNYKEYMKEIAAGRQKEGASDGRGIKGMLPWEAYSLQKEEVPLAVSANRICAGTVTPYPPGIPILYPGEMIGESQIGYISAIIAAGGKVNGIGGNKNIQVVLQ